MKKQLGIFFILIVVMFSCNKSEQPPNLDKPETNSEFNELTATASAYLKEQQDSCFKKYDLLNYSEWNYDQTSGYLEFSDSGVVQIRIKYEQVGTLSDSSGTWLWAWDNPNVLEKVKGEIPMVKAYGSKHNYPMLTKPKWSADEFDAANMTCIAAYLLKAKGLYRVPADGISSYMIFKEIEDLRKEKK